MTFKNEYVPPLEEETSAFLKVAREVLNTGHNKYDEWTVDRARKIALFRTGSGREDAKGQEYWIFLVSSEKYRITTNLVSKENVSSSQISMTMSFSFAQGNSYGAPNDETVKLLKEALEEHGRWHLFNPKAYDQVDLVLLNARTGNEA